jgi:hypothetical protein
VPFHIDADFKDPSGGFFRQEDGKSGIVVRPMVVSMSDGGAIELLSHELWRYVSLGRDETREKMILGTDTYYHNSCLIKDGEAYLFNYNVKN